MGIEQQNMVTKCTPILSQIMSIQDERDVLMESMQAASRARKAREMSQEEHQVLFDDWHLKEGQLRSEVNDLYIQAEADGCL